ncbi:outer membrane protein assembly factor BamB family protein [Natrinema saccharevitans]|uniref:outer membrane protein assembly factor BamB family protein n=1 Tax=Natrinema saccharevitans TaxID=301967 RepID=UPI000A0079FB|nr:PQQ-binding-like beta-propeller repeat protein [Natrinema saccharevitans]
MGWRTNRTRRTWLASCASTAAGISILAGCTSDSSEPADDESEDDALAADTWPMYGVDPQNTGYHPTATGPTSEDVQVRKLFDGEGSISNSPVIVDGTLYVIATTRLHAIDLETGELEWQKEVNASPAAHPAADNERVFAGTRDGIVAADLEDGEVQWRNDIGISSVNPVPVNDGVIGIQNLFLHYFDLKNGNESTLHDMRDHQGGYPYTYVPAVNNGNVYFVSENTIYAVDIEDENIQWQFESSTEEPLGESDPTIFNETVYVGGEDQHLYAIKDGSERWKLEIDEPITCSPSVAPETVYFGGGGAGAQKFFAVDINEKIYEWDPKDLRYSVSAKPVITDDIVYVSSYYDLLAFDTEDGSVTWEIKEFGQEGGESIRAPPAISDETLYVPTAEGNVYAIEDA